jgi:L-alanine-DL-glutamate epimerase-like enolase superfamily enzyme
MSGPRIARLETFTTEWVGFVRVTTDDGDQGWGQLSPYNADITASVLHRQVAPHVLGQDALAPEALGPRVLEAEHKFPGSYVRRALGGVDTALWDLRGRLEGRPVCELLGGTLRPVDAYASSMRRDITAAEEARRLAHLRDEQGFRAFKVRVGKECGHDQDEWPGRTEEVVPAVREALGDDASLLVDANSCYTATRAIEVGKFLEQHGVEHFEEPCPYWELGWTREVTNALSLNVAGGEQDCFLSQWRRIVGERVVDVVQPDVCYVGGFTRSLEVARLAAAAGLPCVPHSANLSLVTVFAIHLLCAIPNAGPYAELSIEGPDYYPWQYGLYDPPLVVDAGRVSAPSGPGWGIDVSSAWLERAAHARSDAA